MKIVLGVYDPVPHPYHHQFLTGGIESWTMTDLNPRHPDIVKVDATDIPYKDLEAIYASHILEHTEDPQKTLKHWHEVLQKNGWVHVNVPDVEWALDAWMRINSGKPSGSEYFRDRDKLMEIFNGGMQSEFDTHKSWFNQSKLYRMMKNAGFRQVTIAKKFEAHSMGCLIARGVK